MPSLDSNLRCPSCASALKPVQLACASCGITVEGPFQLNEFATLAPEDLHFLRIFVRSEGRIREMESALGLSYPTIRSRLSALKTKLQGAEEAARSEDASELHIQKILTALQSGEIAFEVAMERIKSIRAGAGGTTP